MQLFHFWSRDVHPVKNLLLCTKFHENRRIFRWDIAIYRFSKWRPSELFYHHTRLSTKFVAAAAAACQISCQCDTHMWRYSHLAWNAYSGPKMRVLGEFGPLNVIIHHRDPQNTSLRKSASFKLSTVKIRWGVWPVGELRESVTDTQTDRQTDRHAHR